MQVAIFILLVAILIVLLVSRQLIRRSLTGDWVEVQSWPSHRDDDARGVAQTLERSGIKTRRILRGPAGAPGIGMSGQQVTALEVQRKDVARAVSVLREQGEQQRALKSGDGD